VIGSQLRANADTLDEFTAEHFAFHPFSLMGGVREAQRIFGGEAPLDQLLHSLNAAVFGGDDSSSASGEIRPEAPH
jgi:type I restriction enzyme R subunit